MQSRFNSAVEDEIIASSPVARVRIPKAKIDRRERAVLTDTELAIYLAWAHPLKHHQLAVLERQTMSALARMFGGLRTGDIHALNWGHFDITTDDAGEPLGLFTWGMALRRKTARPQRIAVPDSLRPILRDWWTRAGKPSTGLVFPALRGKRAGVGVKKGVSHAEAMRRDLQAAPRGASSRFQIGTNLVTWLATLGLLHRFAMENACERASLPGARFLGEGGRASRGGGRLCSGG